MIKRYIRQPTDWRIFGSSLQARKTKMTIMNLVSLQTKIQQTS